MIENSGCNSGNGLNGSKLYDNLAGDACNDDLHWAYRHHPGRGGITDSMNIVGGTTAPAGAFNVLYAFLAPASSGDANPKYYGATKISESQASPRGAYKGNGLDGINGAANYASCNPSYTDVNGMTWNFCGYRNIPYNQWTPSDPGYWVTVPAFADKPFGGGIPLFPDEVRITKVDCGAAVTVSAYTKLTEDFHLGSQLAGSVTVSVDGGGAQGMTYNSTAKRWEYSGACLTGNPVVVTSTMGDGTGSANTTAP